MDLPDLSTQLNFSVKVLAVPRLNMETGSWYAYVEIHYSDGSQL